MVARLLERAKTSGRADDNEETIKKRYNTSTTIISIYCSIKKRKKGICTCTGIGLTK